MSITEPWWCPACGRLQGVTTAGTYRCTHCTDKEITMTDQLSGDPTITPDGGVVVGTGYTPDHLDPVDPATVLVTDGPVPSVSTTDTPVTITPEPIAWLTPQLRQAIYAAMVSIGAVLGILGVVTPNQWQPVAQSVDAVLAAALALTSLMAIAHLPKVQG